MFSLAWFQPFLGLLQHLKWRQIQRDTFWGIVHRWLGRLLITLAVINGGLGLQLSSNTTKGEIAYGIVAGIIWLTYVACVLGRAVDRKGIKGLKEKEPTTPVSIES